MAWIRSEDLRGQEILDEVIADEIVFVQVKDPREAVVYSDEKEKSYGLHTRT